MEKNPLIQKINKLLCDDLIEISRFGKSEILLVWIPASAIQKVAKTLREDADLQLDWLENLSVVDLDEVFVLSYFVRSTSTPYHLVLRVSQIPEASRKSEPNQILYIPSSKETWPMSEPMENEIEEMFGIHFEKEMKNKPVQVLRNRLLPSGWKGFPLRKDFQFPDQVLGVQHHRDQTDSSQTLL